MDCLYSLRPEEQSTNGGLVVKWFLNRNATPVYQWIHSEKPQSFGPLKDRLKLDYKASDNNATAHRALYIINPTVELSGDYKCLVSTNLDEDFMIKKMIVYGKYYVCVRNVYSFFFFLLSLSRTKRFVSE